MSRPLTITRTGDAQVDTAESVGGGSSLLLDGATDFLTVTNDGTLNTTGDWTVECWFKPVPNFYDMSIAYAGKLTADSAAWPRAGWTLVVDGRGAGSDRIRFYTFYDPSVPGATQSGEVLDYGLTFLTDGGTYDFDWNHVAICGSGSSIFLYLNGVLEATATSQAYADLQAFEDTTNKNLLIGRSEIDVPTSNDFEGWIDEFRISNVRRYTTTFTPPTRATTDSNTLVCIRMDGADGSTTFEDYVGTFGSAELPTATTALQGTATDNPSMVFLGNDVYTWDDADTWDTIYDGSDRWRAWERANTEFDLRAVSTKAVFGSSDLVVNTELSATGLRVKFGQSQLASNTELEVTAERITQGQSNLDVEFTQTTLAERLPQGRSDLNTAFGLAATAEVDVDGRSQITATTTITASARILKLADILVEPFAALTATAEVEVDGKSDLVTAFTQTARGGLLIQVDEPYDYTWDTLDPDTWEGFVLDQWEPNGFFAFDRITLTATGIRLVEGQCALTTAFTQSTEADRLVNAESDLSVIFTQTADANRLVGASADLSSVFAVTATALNLDLASALVAFDFGLEANAGKIIQGQAELSDLLAFEISADRLVNAAAQLDLAFAQNTNATLIPSVLPMDLPSHFQITAQARRFVGGTANLEALATQLTLAERIRNATADFITQFELSAEAGIELNAEIEMRILGFQFAEGRLSDVRGQANLALEFATEFAGDLRLLESNIIYRILRDSRQYDIKSETRALPVLPENRTESVPSENRAYEILPESRRLDIADLMMD